jgi:Putative beta-lactamase-inhibitor-like, PepSY-like
MNMKFICVITLVALLTACGNQHADTTEGGMQNNNTDSITASADPSMYDVNNRVVNPNNNSNYAAPLQVSDNFKKTLQEKYPKAANINWSKYQPSEYIDWEMAGWPALDSNDYVANFTMDEGNTWAWYDEKGMWIGSVTEMNTSGLPDAVNKTVKAQFPGFDIESVDKENDKNRVAYEVQMVKGSDKAKLLIAENGKVLKKKGKIDGEKFKDKSGKDSLKQ